MSDSCLNDKANPSSTRHIAGSTQQLNITYMHNIIMNIKTNTNKNDIVS